MSKNPLLLQKMCRNLEESGSGKSPNPPTLESDDMWFGDPRDMPAKDLTFFEFKK